jgi:predicted RNase H-like HicB family nuclease
MRQYIALVRANLEGFLAAKLPDFPDLSVAAKTLDKLRALLTDDLAACLEKMEQAGIVAPEPSSFERLMADPANQDCAALLVRARGVKHPAPREGASADALHGQSNDEWPEADA